MQPTVLTCYSLGPAGANPFSKATVLLPFNYVADVSLYKVVSITERVKFRWNADAFYVFNI